MSYEEPKTLIEMAIDLFTAHKFICGVVVGLFLYMPLFYFVFGLKMLLWVIL